MPVGSSLLPHLARATARLQFYFILAVLSLSPPVHAVNDISLSLGRIEIQSLAAENVTLAIHMGSGDTVSFTVTATQLSLQNSTLLKDLQISCEQGQLIGMVLACTEASYQGTHEQFGTRSGHIGLQYQLDGHMSRISLPETRFGTGKISGQLETADGQWKVELQGSALELTSLRGLADLFALWPVEYSAESGAIDITLDISGNTDGVKQLSGKLNTHNIGFYGTHAAEALNAETHFELVANDRWHLRSGGEIRNGAVFIDSGITTGNIRPGIALEISEKPLRFDMDMYIDRTQQQIDIKQFVIDHPGVMTSTVRMVADRESGLKIRDAGLQLSVTDAGQFYTTYLQPFLLNTRFNNMEINGAFETDARIDDTSLALLDMQITDVHARDKSGRYNIAGLQGTLQITDRETPVTSTLLWSGASLYRMLFGPGKLVLESTVQGLNIVSWDDVPVLDGQLKIDSLDIINPGETDMTVRLDGSLTPVSMEQFTTTMGWPVMSGQLTAAIDGLSYSRGQLVVDGQIDLGLFDGNIHISNLRIEDLLGLVPKLYADIDIKDIDLELLSNRFTFGQIQGHLGGKVHRLELHAWQPVYFEAALATPADDPTRHRISQKAVENLGYIGGGAAGALSSGFLRMFKNYSYGELGLSCRLYNGSCEMGGVDTTEDGFIIVSRGGSLPPWIEVKGNGHSIKWTTLIEGIKTITSNQPEFE